MYKSNISDISDISNHSKQNNNGEGEANFNKKQFWSYQRLYEKKHGGSHKNIKHSKSKSKNSELNTKKRFHLVNNKIVTDKELVKRLDSIYIPPNYKDLIVAKSAKNKIQAIGTDKKGRRQYVYNHKFTKKRNDRKYDFIVGLGKKIIQIEKDNITMIDNLMQKQYSQWSLPDDYIPIIIYMLRTYHFRIGNEKYANDNESYGITTLKKEHIKFDSNSNKFTIEFIGKKGILNRFSDNNAKMHKLLHLLISNASSDGYLFKYENKNNDEPVTQFITPEHIHSFFQGKYHEEITPKMFRTWYGNYHMLEHLRNLYNEKKLKPRMTKSEINNIITDCSEQVSSKLNNTPTVSKQSYIDNKILDLVIKNPYRFASKIPDSSDGQHKFLYNIILKLRNITEK